MSTVREALARTRLISWSADAPRVCATIAAELRLRLAPQAALNAGDDGSGGSQPVLRPAVVGLGPAGPTGLLRLAVAGRGTDRLPDGAPAERQWLYARLAADGGGELLASGPHLLYALYCLLRDEWLDADVDDLGHGRLSTARLPWLAGRDELLTGRTGFLKQRRDPTGPADLEAGMRELARLGCSHVVVNELASPLPWESGPDGEIYYRFYAYLPDLDQYVETRLNRGTYPREYLQANLERLQSLARLADAYGLVPGMNIANPRSVPEALLERYPYLRGARVDHPFRSYRPRYTLSLAHPVVRWHYAELIRNLLRAVPEIGFLQTLINDSGAGFEYTASLYPGRNGGPYVVREWRSDQEIAACAAENVIRYYRVLRDAARQVRPDFRIITGLKNIAEEAQIIVAGMDDGLDRQLLSQRSDVSADEWRRTRESCAARGSHLFAHTAAKGNPCIPGVPCPWRTAESLRELAQEGFDHVDVALDPFFLVRRDINREVVRAFQLDGDRSVDDVVSDCAARWVGANLAADLTGIWRLADRAVRAAPESGLYSGLGFTWYRLWVRPLVPDIGAIPAADREYYEKHMLAVFNNPHNIDLGADALWQIHTAEESQRQLARFSAGVWEPLDEAIGRARAAAGRLPAGDSRGALFAEVADRLTACRCHWRTIRNVFAWVAAVHGYLEAQDEDARVRNLAAARAMVADEGGNAERLLDLWRTATVDFMPLRAAESMHDYGLNFGELVERKIELMRAYGDRVPRIDPHYMWRLPADVGIDAGEYLKY